MEIFYHCILAWSSLFTNETATYTIEPHLEKLVSFVDQCVAVTEETDLLEKPLLQPKRPQALLEFDACVLTWASTFSQVPGRAYFAKRAQWLPEAVDVCRDILNEARVQHVFPYLALAVATEEGHLRRTPPNSVGKRTMIKKRKLRPEMIAQGPMQVIPYYSCKDDEGVRVPLDDCNLVQAGIKALGYFLDANDHDWCPALAQYNRGSVKGLCKPNRPEYNYAQRVLDKVDLICEVVGCSTC